MSASAQDLSRTTYLGRCLVLCFYPLLTVLAGNAVLLGLPQATETLTAFDGFDQRYAFFLFAVFYWSSVAWYCSRIMLGRHFPVDDLPPCVSAEFSRGVIRWLPRLIGAFSTLPIAAFFWKAGVAVTVLLPVLAVTLGFFVIVIYRRQWFSSWFELPDGVDSAHQLFRFHELQRLSWRFIGMIFFVSFAVLVAIWFSRVSAARMIGAPALLLIALGSWTAFGSMILTYLPRSHRWPSLALAPILLAFIAAIFRENHVVAQEGRDPAADARPALVEDFAKWNKARGEHQNEPVYLVAAAGGASRAAYWTGIVLRNLEQAARAGHIPRVNRVFAMSGVSGGSFGIAAFVGSLAAESAPGARPGKIMQPDPLVFLGEDFLAPLVGGMLYPDAVAAFWPFPCRSCDRSHSIEQAWVDDWRAVSKGNPAAGWFAWELLTKPLAPNLPRLFLNSTSVGDGRRVIQAPVQFAPREAYDLLAATVPALNTKGLTLAGAVHNSARFPYASPAGQVRNSDGDTWDYLADGGYFENSGAATLQAIIEELRKDTTHPENASMQFIVLLIENEPVSEVRWICRRCEESPPKPIPLHKLKDVELPIWPEITAPPDALYQTRTARAQAAEHNIINLLGDCAKPRSVFELRYPKLMSVPKEPPMSWFLNTKTKLDMEQIMCRDDRDGSIGNLKENWSLLLERMGIPRASQNTQCRPAH